MHRKSSIYPRGEEERHQLDALCVCRLPLAHRPPRLPGSMDDTAQRSLLLWVRDRAADLLRPLSKGQKPPAVGLDGAFHDAEYVNLEQIHEQPGGNWALRSNNLKALLRAVELFYHDELGQICPADELVDPLLIAKQNDVHEAAKLTELLLGCAVQCPNKSEYIHPILQMDASE
ncbi:hypothetical protein BBJ28_00014558, partial [Nothophytophthora sp. Chile5]